MDYVDLDYKPRYQLDSTGMLSNLITLLRNFKACAGMCIFLIIIIMCNDYNDGGGDDDDDDDDECLFT